MSRPVVSTDRRHARRRRLLRLVVAGAGLGLGVSGAPAAGPPAHVATSDPDVAVSPVLTYPIHFQPLAPRRDPARPEASYPDDLLRQFMDYHTSGRYELAAEMAMRLVEAAPDASVSHYNLACALSRLRRTDEAIASLARAVETGWRHVAHTALDPDLDPIRRDPAFEHVLDGMMRLAEAERPQSKPLRTDAVPVIATELATLAAKEIESGRVPGLSIAYLREGTVAWAQSFGARDASSGAPLGIDDQFELYSPSHLLALLAAAKQAHDGHDSAVRLVRSVIEHHEALDEQSRPAGAGRLARRESAHALPASDSVVAGWTAAVSRGRADLVFELLCHELELATDDSFRTYCTRQLLRPRGLRGTTFVTSPRAGVDDPDDLAVVTGHSQFGTPVDRAGSRGFRPVGRGMRTTVQDLAALLEPFGKPGDPMGATAQALAGAWRQTGLAARSMHTRVGPMVEITEDHLGCGCLVRWYPEAQMGVVILYNGQQGADVAARLAHHALGGNP